MATLRRLLENEDASDCDEGDETLSDDGCDPESAKPPDVERLLCARLSSLPLAATRVSVLLFERRRFARVSRAFRGASRERASSLPASRAGSGRSAKWYSCSVSTRRDSRLRNSTFVGGWLRVGGD